MAHKPGNKNVRSASVSSMTRQGNAAPYANMPANNLTNNKPKLGTTNGSTSIMGNSPKASSGGGNAVQSSKGNKANMPANNTTNMGVKLGHTAHGVGQVPSYLRGQSGGK